MNTTWDANPEVRSLALRLAVALVACVGCADERRLADGGMPPRDGSEHDAHVPASDAARVDGASIGDCRALGPARGPTQACCPALGVDACGAGLSCAALEGRTIPVCYANGSRSAGEECDQDRLCSSGGCNETTRRCQAGENFACDPAAGCVSTAAARLICADPREDGTPYCARYERGASCTPCETNADCDTANIVGAVFCDLTVRVCKARVGARSPVRLCCEAGSFGSCGSSASQTTCECSPNV